MAWTVSRLFWPVLPYGGPLSAAPHGSACAAALLAVGFLGRSIYYVPSNCGDFVYQWWGGAYALQGKDPYAVRGQDPPNEDRPGFIYPPFTLPFFEVFAIVPLATAKIILTCIHVLICLSLGLLTRRAPLAQDGDESVMLSPALAALLTAPVILSISTHWGMKAGQLGFLVTFALLGALTAQARQPGRPVVAAAYLALAAVKVQTMAPFMLLFLRRRDLRTWLFLSLIMVVLLLVAGNPADLPRQFSAFFDAVAANREPGRTNDNSLLNPLANTNIGVEHVLYRLGLDHRPTITVLALTCTLGLGVWLAYIINSKQDLPRGACCSLVTLYSTVFIYHRTYDLCILILPLFYSVSRLHTVARPARWCYAWVVVAVLLVLNAPYGEFYRIQIQYSSSAILRILVLPSVTYLILSAMVALVAAAYLEARYGSMYLPLTQREEEARPTAVFAGQAE